MGHSKPTASRQPGCFWHWRFSLQKKGHHWPGKWLTMWDFGGPPLSFQSTEGQCFTSKATIWLVFGLTRLFFDTGGISYPVKHTLSLSLTFFKGYSRSVDGEPSYPQYPMTRPRFWDKHVYTVDLMIVWYPNNLIHFKWLYI